MRDSRYANPKYALWCRVVWTCACVGTSRMPPSLQASSSSSGPDVASGSANETDAARELKGLCVKMHKKLAIPSEESLAMSAHSKCTSYMLKIRDLLLEHTTMDAEAKACVLCSGICVWRRANCLQEDVAEVRNLSITLTLLFVLLVLSEKHNSPEDEQAGEKTEEMLTIETWEEAAIADSLFASTGVHASSWSSMLRSDAFVSRSALKEGTRLKDDCDLADFARLASTFFECSATATVSSFLGSTGTAANGYVALDAVAQMQAAIAHHGQTLEGIANAAESESGQQVLRDLILSFKLPKHVVRVRRTLLLSREANAVTSRNYTDTLNVAHEAAMRGATWSWGHDADLVHKAAALLAGLAVIFAQKKDEIRKGDAFAGKVNLPFLDCPPPPEHVRRIALVPASSEWVVYSLKNGRPCVSLRERGFTGLCSAVVLLLQSK